MNSVIIHEFFVFVPFSLEIEYYKKKLFASSILLLLLLLVITNLFMVMIFIERSSILIILQKKDRFRSSSSYWIKLSIDFSVKEKTISFRIFIYPTDLYDNNNSMESSF